MLRCLSSASFSEPLSTSQPPSAAESASKRFLTLGYLNTLTVNRMPIMRVEAEQNSKPHKTKRGTQYPQALRVRFRVPYTPDPRIMNRNEQSLPLFGAGWHSHTTSSGDSLQVLLRMTFELCLLTILLNPEILQP